MSSLILFFFAAVVLHFNFLACGDALLCSSTAWNGRPVLLGDVLLAFWYGMVVLAQAEK